MAALLQALGDDVWFMVEAGYTPPTKTTGTGTEVVTGPKLVDDGTIWPG